MPVASMRGANLKRARRDERHSDSRQEVRLDRCHPLCARTEHTNLNPDDAMTLEEGLGGCSTIDVGYREGLVGTVCMCPGAVCQTHTSAAPLKREIVKYADRQARISRYASGENNSALRAYGYVGDQAQSRAQSTGSHFTSPFKRQGTAPALVYASVDGTDYICTTIGLSDRAIRQKAKCRSRRKKEKERLLRLGRHTRSQTYLPRWCIIAFLGLCLSLFACIVAPVAHARGRCGSWPNSSKI